MGECDDHIAEREDTYMNGQWTRSSSHNGNKIACFAEQYRSFDEENEVSEQEDDILSPLSDADNGVFGSVVQVALPEAEETVE